jgi:hypothetical protein
MKAAFLLSNEQIFTVEKRTRKDQVNFQDVIMTSFLLVNNTYATFPTVLCLKFISVYPTNYRRNKKDYIAKSARPNLRNQSIRFVLFHDARLQHSALKSQY